MEIKNNAVFTTMFYESIQNFARLIELQLQVL